MNIKIGFDMAKKLNQLNQEPEIRTLELIGSYSGERGLLREFH